jgi:hypothetical protein
VTRVAAITYDGLPISSGGAHKLRTRGFTDALLVLQSFVTAVSLDPCPRHCFVEVLAGDDVPASFTSGVVAHCDAQFVKGTRRRVGEYSSSQWAVDPGELPALIDSLEQRRPIPKAGYAGYASTVHVTWNIVFGDGLRQPIPYQGKEHYLGFECAFQRHLGESLVYATISEATTANLFLALPYESVTSEARKLAEKIQSQFPARLSPRHWKIWRLTKKGDGYIGRRVSML